MSGKTEEVEMVSVAVAEAIDTVKKEVDEYKRAEDALLMLESIQLTIKDLCEQELQQIEILQKRIADKTVALLAEKQIELTEKDAEKLQKDVRKRLFEPMIVIVDDGTLVKGKTYEQPAYTVTLVESKPTLAPRSTLTTEEYGKAHKEDVQRFIDAGLYSLLSIKADEATAAYANASALSGNPLKSVELVRSGYCKVKLTS